jgi:hypothetical protein
MVQKVTKGDVGNEEKGLRLLIGAATLYSSTADL